MTMRHTQESDPEPRLRLTEARTVRKWSQQEVADHIGTTHVNVSRWERGITRPSPYFRRRLCQVFGKTEEELDLQGARGAAEEGAGHPQGAPVHFNIMEGQAGNTGSGEALYDPAIPLQPAIELVGRDREMAQIRQRILSGGSVALTALNGLPGVGKTALSITLAHDAQVRAHLRDGVLWAGLGPAPNLPGLLSRWGMLLGMAATEMAALSGNEAWARALHSAIGARRMLLVIDDAWRIEEALTLKVGGPNCVHLVTTRFPAIASHLAFGGATVLHELDEAESLDLLRLLAPGVVERETQKARTLVHAVGGLPLALTLMGNYLRKQAHSGPARRIHTTLERLTNAEERLRISEPHGPVERHSSLTSETPLSLQSVFAVTDQLLGEEARAALYALSAFPSKPNSFSEEAALVVAACSVETLDALSDSGLLESTVSDRYTLHQTIADYAASARDRLHDDAPHERLVAYCADYVEAHKTDYELLEIESSTILAALEVAHTLGKRAALVRTVSAFAPFLLVRAMYQPAERYVQWARESALAEADSYGVTTALLYLGEIAQKRGDFIQANAYFQEGLILARQIGDQERISALLTGLGTVSWKRGEYNQAEAYLQEGLALARQIYHLERISGLLETLGSVAGIRGDYIQSKTYIEEGLKLAHLIGDRERICTLLINLGATVGEQGNHAQAEEYFQEGLIIARQIGHREWISLLLINLGDTAGEAGNYAQAEAYFQEGLILAQQIEHREWISALLINLGLTTRKQGNYAQAEIYLQESLALARQLGRPEMTSNALNEYGNLYLNQQKIEAAEIMFTEMLTITPEGDQELIALAQYGQARVAAARGKFQEARRLGEISITALETMGHRNAAEVRHWLNSTIN